MSKPEWQIFDESDIADCIVSATVGYAIDGLNADLVRHEARRFIRAQLADLIANNADIFVDTPPSSHWESGCIVGRVAVLSLDRVYELVSKAYAKGGRDARRI